MLIVYTALLGGLGALVRVLILQSCARVSKYFPVDTLVVNICACLGAGVVVGLQLPHTATYMLMGGLIGGMGTLSAICADSINLIRKRAFLRLGAKIFWYMFITPRCFLRLRRVKWDIYKKAHGPKASCAF